MKKFILAQVACVIFLVSSVSASELFGSAGLIEDTRHGDRSYAWGLDYVQGLTENLAFSIGYLNEGHVPKHHRDGQSAMLWGRANFMGRKLSLAAGAGSYFYYDTVDVNGSNYRNKHDLGLITSIAANWYTDSRFILQLRANTIYANRNFDTQSVLFGVGYQLDAPDKPGPLASDPPRSGKTTDNELAVYLGKTIVNSMDSEKSTAVCVEYRRGLMKYLDGTVAWMNEGRNDVLRRNGIISELWLTKAFLDERFALAYGLGGYFAVDKSNGENRGGTNEVASMLNTLSVSYRIKPTPLVVRAHWNRMITGYDRDADVIMGGIGYRF